jgi:hypothetical protein
VATAPTRSHTKQRRHSKISQLPAELHQQVHALLDAGHTYAEIAQHLTALDHPISKSAVGAYSQQFLERQRRVAETAEKAAALVGAVGNVDLEEAAARLSLDLVVRKLLDITELEATDDLVGVMSTIARMQTAAVTRERWKTDVAKRARAAADDVAKTTLAEGLSAEVVSEIRAKILGIGEGASHG